MKKLISFHGEPKLKEQYLNQLLAHAKADEFIHGTYWQNGKGCAVGCTIHSSNHFRYETDLGIPYGLARAEDTIFETLPNDLAKKWPVEFLEAIPVGKELDKVTSAYYLWLINDEKYGLIHKETWEDRKAVFTKLVEVINLSLAGPVPEPVMKELAYLADLAYFADLTDRAYRTDLADLADRAYRTDRAEASREKLLELLKSA